MNKNIFTACYFGQWDDNMGAMFLSKQGNEPNIEENKLTSIIEKTAGKVSHQDYSDQMNEIGKFTYQDYYFFTFFYDSASSRNPFDFFIFLAFPKSMLTMISRRREGKIEAEFSKFCTNLYNSSVSKGIAKKILESCNLIVNPELIVRVIRREAGILIADYISNNPEILIFCMHDGFIRDFVVWGTQNDVTFKNKPFRRDYSAYVNQLVGMTFKTAKNSINAHGNPTKEYKSLRSQVNRKILSPINELTAKIPIEENEAQFILKLVSVSNLTFYFSIVSTEDVQASRILSDIDEIIEKIHQSLERRL